MHLLFTFIFHLKLPERKQHTNEYFTSIKVNPLFLKQYKQCFKISLSFSVFKVLLHVILNVTEDYTSPSAKHGQVYTHL